MSNSDTLVGFPSLSACEKVHHLHFGTDITPPCFSSMCFQSGLLPLFLSTSSTYCEPLWKMFFSPLSQTTRIRNYSVLVCHKNPGFFSDFSWILLKVLDLLVTFFGFVGKILDLSRKLFGLLNNFYGFINEICCFGFLDIFFYFF